MDKKLLNLIIVNGLGLLSFGIVFFIMQRSMAAGIFLLLFLAVFLIVANFRLLLTKPDVRKQLGARDKRGYFRQEIATLSTQLASIEARQPVIDDKATDGMVRIEYYKIRDRMYYNLDLAEKFLDNYDYVMKPPSDNLQKIITENYNMLNKLNELIDAMLSLDMSVGDVDLSEIDAYLDGLHTAMNEE